VCVCVVGGGVETLVVSEKKLDGEIMKINKYAYYVYRENASEQQWRTVDRRSYVAYYLSEAPCVLFVPPSGKRTEIPSWY